MNRSSAWLWLAGAVLATIAAVQLAHLGSSPSRAAADHAPVAPVRVALVVQRTMPVLEHTTATVMANTVVQVTARVPGTLEAAEFKEGQFVNKGDLLFKIDPLPYRAAQAQAQAVLLRDQALLRNAIRDRARYEHLFKLNAISSQQRDTSATNADVLAATVAADKAALDVAKLNLGYTQIRSPVGGKTGPILVQPGNTIQANATTPLVTIAQLRPVKLSMNVPESEFAAVQALGLARPLPITLDIRGKDGKPLSGTIDFTGNAVNGQSGTVELRATLPNTDLTLLPGQLVNVEIDMRDIPHALIVPQNAINQGPDGTYVFVVVHGRAEQRPVSVIQASASEAAVRGQIKAGDAVIVEGQLRVEPGGRVEVHPAAGSHK